MPSPPKPVHLPGTTLEGGGQLLRLALSLSSLTSTPIRITDIRGKRPSGGGLKRQHLTAVEWLARASGADVEGAEKGSHTLLFRPGATSYAAQAWWTEGPSVDQASLKKVVIEQDSPGSIGLVLQAVLPYILFSHSSSPASTPVTLSISGGTNVTFSPSYEYIRQVLLPTLEAIGLPRIETSLEARGWTTGRQEIGSASFTITPLCKGQSLPAFHLAQRGDITTIHVTILAPASAIAHVRQEILSSLASKLPETAVEVVLEEDSRSSKRLYLLLVALTQDGRRLGRDWLYDHKITDLDTAVKKLVKMVVGQLCAELRSGGCVDEYLQDQLVVFQALANGRSVVLGGKAINSASQNRGGRETDDAAARPASLHTQTARWVAGEVLDVTFDDDGTCDGIGFVVGKRLPREAERDFAEMVGERLRV